VRLVFWLIKKNAKQYKDEEECENPNTYFESQQEAFISK